MWTAYITLNCQGYNCTMLDVRAQAQRLRQQGMTYAEIRSELKLMIPKSTLSYWCKDVALSSQSIVRIGRMSAENLARGREKALAQKMALRDEKVRIIRSKNRKLVRLLHATAAVRKIALAVLYLAEGSKTNRHSLMFGNSSPDIVALFLHLLRDAYELDESKFRITVQCRADQSTHALEEFWSRLTNIPRSQFYKSRIDARTVGKLTKKADYKGVCRIDYFSSDIDMELKYLAQDLQRV